MVRLPSAPAESDKVEAKPVTESKAPIPRELVKTE
jgi:hypothetical protein